MNKNSFTLISRSAVRATPAMHKRTRIVLDMQAQSIADSWRHGGDPVSQIHTMEHTWVNVLGKMKEPWALAYAVDGYNLSGTLLHKKSFVGAGMSGGAGDVFAKRQLQPTIDLEGADSLVANFLKPKIADWVLKTSKIETETTARMYQAIIQAALSQQLTDEEGRRIGATIAELADEFLATSLKVNEARAEMMAATLTNWNYNEGASTLYEHEGITEEEWLTTEDDRTCEFCDEMDGQKTQIRENYFGSGEQLEGRDGGTLNFDFEIEHPPLHPNCRCCLVPVV